MCQRIKEGEYNSVCSNLFEDSEDDSGVVVEVYEKMDREGERETGRDRGRDREEFVTQTSQSSINYFRNNASSNHSSMKYSPCTSVSTWNLKEKAQQKYRPQKENSSQNFDYGSYGSYGSYGNGESRKEGGGGEKASCGLRRQI